MTESHELTQKDYQAGYSNDWCAGCGDFGILRALEKALAELVLPPEQVAVFGGIGCSGKTPYYLNTYGIHTLHGRVLPFAAGAKLANPALNVIAVGGDGDGLSIGAGHFVNAGRRNLDMTYILFNNGVYGLTKGQAAPTLSRGLQTKGMAQANMQEEVNPILLALTSGYTWVGRGYAYDVKQLVTLMREAISHPGLAFLDVLQPCPTYNDLHTKEWFSGKGGKDKGRVYSLQEEGHDPLIAVDADDKSIRKKKAHSMALAMEWGERIPSGVFLQDLSRPELGQQLADSLPYYAHTPPAVRPVADAKGRPLSDLSDMLTEFMIEP